MMRNGLKPPRVATDTSSRFEYDGAPGNQHFLEAVKTLTETAGNVYDVLNMANIQAGNAPAVSGLYDRGFRRLKRQVGAEGLASMNSGELWERMNCWEVKQLFSRPGKSNLPLAIGTIMLTIGGLGFLLYDIVGRSF